MEEIEKVIRNFENTDILDIYFILNMMEKNLVPLMKIQMKKV